MLNLVSLYILNYFCTVVKCTPIISKATEVGYTAYKMPENASCMKIEVQEDH